MLREGIEMQLDPRQNNLHHPARQVAWRSRHRAESLASLRLSRRQKAVKVLRIRWPIAAKDRARLTV